MPKIPMYDELLVERSKTLGTPTLSLDVPLTAVGGGTAKAIEGIGGSMQDLAERQKKLKEKRDRLYSSEQITEYQKGVYELLENSETGAYTRTGSHAVGMTREIQEKDLPKLRELHVKKLKTDEQRAWFKLQIDDFDANVGRQVSRYERLELEKWEIKQAESAIALAEERARMEFGSPGKCIATVLELTEKVLKLEGVDDDTRALITKNTESELWRDTIISLSKESPTLAAERFSRMKKAGVFTEEDKENVRKTLETETLLARAQGTADDIILKYDLEDSAGLDNSWDEARKEAEKLTDASLRAGVLQQINSAFQFAIGQRAADMNQLRDNTYLKIDQAVTAAEAEDYVTSIAQKLTDLGGGAYVKSLRSTIHNKFYVTEAAKAADPEIYSKFTQVLECIDRAEDDPEHIGSKEQLAGAVAELPKVLRTKAETYFRKDGNLQYFTRSKMREVFEGQTNYNDEDRPEAFGDFWAAMMEYGTQEGARGTIPTQAQFDEWGVEWMRGRVTARDFGFLAIDFGAPDFQGTRAEAVRHGWYKEYRKQAVDDLEEELILGGVSEEEIVKLLADSQFVRERLGKGVE